jgi:DNA-binding NtrC family response regulator
VPLSGTHRAAIRPTDGSVHFVLRVVNGSPPRPEIASNAERLVIGRQPPSDFCLDDPSVAQPHCEIVTERESFVLKDLGSVTGTRVAGLRVQSAYLPPEARIVVGGVELAFNVIAQQEPVDQGFGALLGESEVMHPVIERLARVAGRDTTLLLEGESGTGKRLAAESVHSASARHAAPFVLVDCRSGRSALLEAELFGRDAGADGSGKSGAFAIANGGTLFLDEVGELGLDLQRRLLRALEHHEVTDASGRATQVDVRIIAATSRDLYREIGRGVFRDDLYYSLAVATVRIPPLRERLSDIPLLVKHFLSQHSLKDGVAYTLDEAVLARLALRPWPGNVRELRNAVETILAFGTDEVPAEKAAPREVPLDIPFKAAKARLVEGFERDYLVSVLGRHGGNITAAATAAGLDRVHFLRLLDRYGLRKSGTRPAAQ